MALQNYAVIDENTLICVNVIVWDGETTWSPPLGTFAQVIEGVGIGDEVELVGDVYVKVEDEEEP